MRSIESQFCLIDLGQPDDEGSTFYINRGPSLIVANLPFGIEGSIFELQVERYKAALASNSLLSPSDVETSARENTILMIGNRSDILAIGLSVKWTSEGQLDELCKVIQLLARSPDLSKKPILIGGNGVSVRPDEILRMVGDLYNELSVPPPPLFLFTGYSEVAAGKILSAIKNGLEPVQAIKDIPHNLAIIEITKPEKANEAYIIKTHHQKLSSLSYSQQTSDQKLLMALGAVQTLEASRGCEKSCRYCSYHHGRKNYPQAAFREQLVSLIDKGKYGYITDEDFLRRPDVEDLIHIIESSGRKVIMTTSVNQIWDEKDTPDVRKTKIDRLNRLNPYLHFLFMGVEYGSEATLKRERKNQTVQDNRKAIRLLRGEVVDGEWKLDNPVKFYCGWMFTSPEMTLHEMIENVSFWIENMAGDPFQRNVFMEMEAKWNTDTERALEKAGLIDKWDGITSDHRPFAYLYPSVQTVVEQSRITAAKVKAIIKARQLREGTYPYPVLGRYFHITEKPEQILSEERFNNLITQLSLLQADYLIQAASIGMTEVVVIAKELLISSENVYSPVLEQEVLDNLASMVEANIVQLDYSSLSRIYGQLLDNSLYALETNCPVDLVQNRAKGLVPEDLFRSLISEGKLSKPLAQSVARSLVKARIEEKLIRENKQLFTAIREILYHFDKQQANYEVQRAIESLETFVTN